MTSADPEAELLDRLRQRIADESQRVDMTVSGFMSGLRQGGLGSMASMLRELTGDLARLLQSPGTPPPDIVSKADQLQSRMNEPAPSRPLPRPASPEEVDSAEAAIGAPLPALLRRIYLEVADGGFGPGYGIVGVGADGWTDEDGHSLVDLFQTFDSEGAEDEIGEPWPKHLVPIVSFGDGAFVCVDCRGPDEPVLELDLTELDEEPDLGDALREIAPSLAAWLTDWLDAPPPPSPSGPFMIGPQSPFDIG